MPTIGPFIHKRVNLHVPSDPACMTSDMSNR